MTQPDLTAGLASGTPAYTLHRRAGTANGVAHPVNGVAEERRAGLARCEVARIIAERQFTLAFQPIVALADRGPVAHEALLRLRPAADIITVPSGVFVDLAARWGLGAALDAAVLDAALAVWEADRGLPVSVNITAAALIAPAFLRQAIDRIGPNAAAVVVEVSDAAGLADTAALAQAVASLRASGVRVALDDLGADPRLLDIVRAARFDQMKLHGGCLRAAAAGARGRQMLAALVALAGSAGAEVVAKHIETLPQAWLVAELGVRYGQGWLFGAPGARMA